MKIRLFTKKVRNLFLLFLFLSTVIVSAQSKRTVTGTVFSSEDNSPLPGASVVEKGTTNGTSTDFDGKFTLDVSSDATTLIVSFIGYKAQEVTITNSLLTITLQVDANALDEVVVVGYGTQKKSDIVSSVTSVEMDEATAIPTTNVSEMLRGRAAGVQINLTDARPGGTSEIIIRGKVSLEGNDPLIIVDGVPYDKLNDIPADDIASIEILKDASATAIYGSRASNGIILVTTKRGKEGKIAINYHGYLTTQKLTRNFDLYSAEEFIALRREANRDRITGEYLGDEAIFTDFELQSIANQNYVNWEDLILEDAILQSHSLSVSSGTEKTKIYSSINYFKQDGLIPTSGYERGTFKLNVDQKINDKLSFLANINYQTGTQDKESNSIGFINLSPLAIPYDENGNLVKFPLGEASTTVNPLWNILESTNDIKTNLTDVTLAGTYRFTPSFSYTLNTFLRNRNEREGLYRTSLHSEGDQGVDGYAELRNLFYKQFLLENIINYNPNIGEDHQLDFTFVHSIDEISSDETEIRKSGFANDALGYNGSATVLSVDPANNGRVVKSRKMVSFLGRARYGFKDKYLFNFSLRADGSSVFAENNKWGYFPAAAFAWKIHNESFLEDSSDINELKFRVSYGSTGNQGINSEESLGKAIDAPYVFGGTTSGGFIAATRLPNPDLSWETTNTFNIGVDFGLFNNLFTGSIEYYKAKTNDLLLDRVVPAITGFTVTRFNVGNVENKGLEATLNTNIVNKEDLKWSVGLTYSTNENKVTKLTGELDEDGNPLDLSYTDGNGVTRRLSVGEPINNNWYAKYDGIWQVGDDLTAITPNPLPGDVRVIDQNGDGIIDQQDNVYISADPDWYGSITTTLNYKNFELFADFYLVQGVMKFNPVLSNGELFKGAINGIKLPYYTIENPSTTIPQPRNDTASNLYPFAVRDASYSRLRTLTLGYNFPEDMVGKLGFSSAKIYATATNLFTITDFKSYSPENNPYNFPDAKGMTFGVKLGF